MFKWPKDQLADYVARCEQDSPIELRTPSNKIATSLRSALYNYLRKQGISNIQIKQQGLCLILTKLELPEITISTEK